MGVESHFPNLAHEAFGAGTIAPDKAAGKGVNLNPSGKKVATASCRTARRPRSHGSTSLIRQPTQARLARPHHPSRQKQAYGTRLHGPAVLQLSLCVPTADSNCHPLIGWWQWPLLRLYGCPCHEPVGFSRERFSGSELASAPVAKRQQSVTNAHTSADSLRQ
jgi:hypothetical protein